MLKNLNGRQPFQIPLGDAMSTKSLVRHSCLKREWCGNYFKQRGWHESRQTE